MLDRLKQDPEGKKDYRRELDSSLQVRDWLMPGQIRQEVSSEDPRAPYWWRGEEEASDSFLAAMGVRL